MRHENDGVPVPYVGQDMNSTNDSFMVVDDINDISLDRDSIFIEKDFKDVQNWIDPYTTEAQIESVIDKMLANPESIDNIRRYKLAKMVLEERIPAHLRLILYFALSSSTSRMAANSTQIKKISNSYTKNMDVEIRKMANSCQCLQKISLQKIKKSSIVRYESTEYTELI